MEIDDSNAEVRINASVTSTAGKLLVNDLIRSKSLIASGSSTPSLRVGPNTTQGYSVNKNNEIEMHHQLLYLQMLYNYIIIVMCM